MMRRARRSSFVDSTREGHLVDLWRPAPRPSAPSRNILRDKITLSGRGQHAEADSKRATGSTEMRRRHGYVLQSTTAIPAAILFAIGPHARDAARRIRNHESAKSLCGAPGEHGFERTRNFSAARNPGENGPVLETAGIHLTDSLSAALGQGMKFADLYDGKANRSGAHESSAATQALIYPEGMESGFRSWAGKDVASVALTGLAGSPELAAFSAWRRGWSVPFSGVSLTITGYPPPVFY